MLKTRFLTATLILLMATALPARAQAESLIALALLRQMLNFNKQSTE